MTDAPPPSDGRGAPPPMVAHVVVMGVSGSGKSTVATRLAYRLGWEFGEGDAFHPIGNVEKMAAGVPLTDRDRRPWLDRLAAWIARHDAADRSSVLACSALRRAYRDALREGAERVCFIQLTGPEEVLAARMEDRDGHFMPGTLLRSQLDTVEDLGADEDGLILDIRDSPEALAAAAATWLTTGKS